MQNENKSLSTSLKARKSIRLKEYDYSEPGDYFITICIKDRENLFGEIIDGKMKVNKIGEVVKECWLEIPKHFPDIELDIDQMMPNHMHGVIRILELDDVGIGIVGNRHACSTSGDDASIRNSHGCSLQGGLRQYQKLPVVIGSFKSSVTRICNQKGLRMQWQKSYHDHIIRNEKSYDRVYNYIESNVSCWQEDLENLEFEKQLSEKERELRLKEFYKKLF